jgi:hypothetical protein
VTAVAVDRTEELVMAVLHVVGQGRAFIDQLDFALGELRAGRDERAERAIEALEMTLREPAVPGTVRHVVQAASALLLDLREVEAE